MEIRLLSQQELLPALHLVWEVFAQDVAPSWTPEGVEEFRKFIKYENIAPLFERKEQIFFGAFDGGQMTGVIAVGSDGLISLFFVRKSCQRKGIGKLLFQIQDFNGHRDISFIQGDTVRVACEENPEMREAVEKIMDKYRLNEKLATAKEALIHDRTINKFDYTPIGALVTAAYAKRFQKEMPAYKDQPVIGVNHYGGIRAALPKGDITRLRAGNILPFGSAIVAYRFDGKRLKKLLEDGRKNPNGFLQSSDLTLTLSGNKIEKIVYTRDGQKTEIEDNTPCVVTLDAFITDGGDGYDASLFKGYEIPEFDKLGIISTDAFMDYLKGFKKPITVESTHMPVISK